MIEPALNNKHVCHACIGEQYLSNEIKNSNNIFKCDYCKKTKPSISIEELSSEIEKVFEDHYKRTKSGPDDDYYLVHGDIDFEREGENVIDVIQNVADIEDMVVADILEILQERNFDFEKAKMGYESEFDSDSHYMKRSPDSEYWNSKWRICEGSLKTRSRFFNHEVNNLLAGVFNKIDEIKTHNNNPLVVEVGSQTEFDHLYRARSFQDYKQLEKALARPDKEIGSPPHKCECWAHERTRYFSFLWGN